MKKQKIHIILFLFISIFSFAQEFYTEKSGGRIFNSKNEKLSPTQVRENFTTDALKLYNIGRSKKTYGNLMLYTGAGCVIINTIDYLKPRGYDYSANNKSSKTLFIVGGALIVTSIPVKIGFRKKIRESVSIMNDYYGKKDNTSIEFKEVLINQNGIGISIQF